MLENSNFDNMDGEDYKYQPSYSNGETTLNKQDRKEHQNNMEAKEVPRNEIQHPFSVLISRKKIKKLKAVAVEQIFNSSQEKQKQQRLLQSENYGKEESFKTRFEKRSSKEGNCIPIFKIYSVNPKELTENFKSVRAQIVFSESGQQKFNIETKNLSFYTFTPSEQKPCTLLVKGLFHTYKEDNLINFF